MTRIVRLLVAVAGALAVWVPLVAGQVVVDPHAYGLVAGLPIRHADRVADGTSPGIAYRMYGEEIEAFELWFDLSNAGQLPIHFDESMVKRATRIAVVLIDDGTGAATSVPVEVTWEGVLQGDSPGPVVTLPSQMFLVESGKGVKWSIRLTRADGLPFTAARYRIEVEWDSLRSAIRTQDGDPLPEGALPYWWSGLLRGDMELRIQRPSTPRELSAMYRTRGVAAASANRLDDALGQFRRAVESDLTDEVARLYLGQTLVRAGRYAEAIPLLERLPLAGGSGSVQRALALAYLGAGDEGAARNVFRRAGVPENAIGARMEGVREMLGWVQGR